MEEQQRKLIWDFRKKVGDILDQVDTSGMILSEDSRTHIKDMVSIEFSTKLQAERNRILGVAESIKSTATLEPDGDASKVTNYMAGRQEGWNAALAKLADEVGKGN